MQSSDTSPLIATKQTSASAITPAMKPKFSYDTAGSSATARVAVENNPESFAGRQFLALSARAAGGQEPLRVVPVLLMDDESPTVTFGTETVAFGEVGIGIESGVELLGGRLALSWASWFMHRARIGLGTWQDERDESISGTYIRSNQYLAYAASVDAKLKLYENALVQVSMGGRAQFALSHAIADDLWNLSDQKQVETAPLPDRHWEFIPRLSGGIEIAWR